MQGWGDCRWKNKGWRMLETGSNLPAQISSKFASPVTLSIPSWFSFVIVNWVPCPVSSPWRALRLSLFRVGNACLHIAYYPIIAYYPVAPPPLWINARALPIEFDKHCVPGRVAPVTHCTSTPKNLMQPLLLQTPSARQTPQLKDFRTTDPWSQMNWGPPAHWGF